MRVLLKDKRDGALAVVEAIEMNYDPSDGEMCVCLHGGDSYAIENLNRAMADHWIRLLYTEGRVDLIEYEARYDPVDDYNPAEDDV